MRSRRPTPGGRGGTARSAPSGGSAARAGACRRPSPRSRSYVGAGPSKIADRADVHVAHRVSRCAGTTRPAGSCDPSTTPGQVRGGYRDGLAAAAGTRTGAGLLVCPLVGEQGAEGRGRCRRPAGGSRSRATARTRRGVSGAASRHTGASRCSKHSSATNAATSAPKPHVSVSSCRTSTRPVLRTDSATMSRSHGAIVRRSTISTPAVGAELLRRELGAVHGRAPRHDRDAIAARHVRALAERQHPVGGRHRIAVVALPVQVLVLEEQHRVLAPERGAQEARRRRARATGTRSSSPGTWAKIDSPHWLCQIAPPWR